MNLKTFHKTIGIYWIVVNISDIKSRFDRSFNYLFAINFMCKLLADIQICAWYKSNILDWQKEVVISVYFWFSFLHSLPFTDRFKFTNSRCLSILITVNFVRFYIRIIRQIYQNYFCTTLNWSIRFHQWTNPIH